MDNFHIINFHEVFAEVCFCVSKKLNIKVEMNFEPQENHFYLVFGAHEQAPTLYNIQMKYKTIKYIIFNSEPPASQFLRNKFYISLMRGNIVFDYHKLSADYLKTLGIRVLSKFFFEFPYNPVSNERDIDILFVGSKTERREKVHKDLLSYFPNKKIVFNFDWKYKNHKDLTDILNRSKIVLNIPFHDHKILETHRINKALACNCSVISLYSGDKETDDFYKDYIYFTNDIVEYLLSDSRPEEKKLYPELIQKLSPLTKHNEYIIRCLNNK